MSASGLRFQAVHLREVARHRVLRLPLSPVRFVIFGRGRSGSTTLVSLLDALPGLTCDGEILSRRVLMPRAHVHARCANSRAPTYGCKILSYQLRSVQPLARPELFLRRLSDDGFRVIYLKRENVVEHAISNIRAREFGFHRNSSQPNKAAKTIIERGDLMHWIGVSERNDRFEADAVSAVVHLPLTYERDLAYDHLHAHTVRRVCEFLGLHGPDAASVRSRFAKISPGDLRDSVANYDELVTFLQGTPYARYLL